MPGLFSRLKTWNANEVLVYSDLNAEFDNIISNLEADTLGGYSATVAQMRSQVNPGSVGSESQASSISGELERIRFVISRIVGKTYWYDTPARSLQSFNIDHRHLFAPKKDNGIQSAIADAVDAGILDVSGFSILGAYNSTFKGGQGKFSAYSIANGAGSSAHCYRLDSGRLNSKDNTYSIWFKNFAAGDTIFENPFMGIRLYLNLSGFLQLDITEYSVSGANKSVKSITGSTSFSGSASWNNAYFSYEIQDLATDTACLYANGALVGNLIGQIKVKSMGSSNSPAFLFSSISNNPSITTAITQNNNLVPTSNGWTLTGTGSESLSDGILTVTTPAAGQRFYSNSSAPGSTANSVWFESKFRISAATPNVFQQIPANMRTGYLNFIYRAATTQRACAISITGGLLTVSGASGTNATVTQDRNPSEYNHDFTQWTKMTVIVGPTPVHQVSVYINDKFVASCLAETDTTAGNLLAFGKFDNNSADCTFEMEYIRCGTGVKIVRPNNTTTQEISDFVALRGYQQDTSVISGLQSSSPFDLFGPEKDTRVTERESLATVNVQVTAAATPTLAIMSVGVYSNGKRPTSIFIAGTSEQGVNTNTGNHFGQWSYIVQNSTSIGMADTARLSAVGITGGFGGSTYTRTFVGATGWVIGFGGTVVGAPVTPAGLNTIQVLFSQGGFTGASSRSLYASFLAYQV